jgi:hypothetical protein
VDKIGNLLAVLTDKLQFARFFNFSNNIHPTASDEAPIEPKNAKGSMNLHQTFFFEDIIIGNEEPESILL